jgi:hypothetical protein
MPMIESPERAFDELAERIDDADCGVFVVRGGFLIGENNRSEFVRACTVIHVYAEKAGALRQLLSELEHFARAGGLERIHGVDINQRGRAYERLFARTGWHPQPIGMFYQWAS